MYHHAWQIHYLPLNHLHELGCFRPLECRELETRFLPLELAAQNHRQGQRRGVPGAQVGGEGKASLGRLELRWPVHWRR
jgi:hypothetical protein